VLLRPLYAELKVWSSFIHLPHRQASYDVPLLPECLPYPFKELWLSGILGCVTEHHCALGECIDLLFACLWVLSKHHYATLGFQCVV
jgi:hypothetical protein